MLKRRVCCAALAGMLALSLAGCGNKPDGEDAKVTDDVQFPITDQEIELRYWQPMNSKLAANVGNIGEVECLQELQKITGVKLKFESPAVGQDSEQFNLLLASKDLPDIIFYKWIGQSQTPDKFIEDGIIQSLTPYIGTVAANLDQLMQEDPHTKKEITDDNGDYFMFPMLKMDEKMRVNRGFSIRQDWLNKVGLQVPTNQDELYNVLKAFKEQDPNGNGQADEIPLVSKKSEGIIALMAMFGVNNEFILKDGKVVFSPMEPEFKDALEFLSKLYAEKLLDVDYSLSDDKAIDAKVTSNTAGVMYGLGSNLNRWSQTMTKKDPAFELTAISQFKAPDGKGYMNNRVVVNANNGYGSAISRENKYPAITAKLLDYAYGKEGNLLFNYGVEGDTYTLVDGEPQFTDKVMKPGDGKTPGDIVTKYCFAASDQAMVLNPDTGAKLTTPETLVVDTEPWKENYYTGHLLPTMSYTLDENRKMFSTMSDIETYRDEMIDKFIMGAEPISNFDSFVAQLKSMGIEDIIKIKQDAYDRFQAK